MKKQLITIALMAMTTIMPSMAQVAFQPKAVTPSVPKEIVKTSAVYRDTLKMDIFVDTTVQTKGPRPLFLYDHGGGWNEPNYQINVANSPSAFYDLLHNGFVVAAIDYRQGVRMATKEGRVKAEEVMPGDSKVIFDRPRMVSVLREAQLMAVEDLFDATTYLVNNASRWNIDTARVIVGGGSAGAINSLRAENMICNSHPLALKHLPRGFHYAGVIACAGWMWMENGKQIEWKTKPCPIMLYHGTNDNIVYCDSLSFRSAPVVLYGTKQIAKSLKDIKVPYWVTYYDGYDHVVSGLPFENNGYEMLAFIRRYVFNKEKVSEVATEQCYEGPRSLLAFYAQKMGIPKEKLLEVILKGMKKQFDEQQKK